MRVIEAPEIISFYVIHVVTDRRGYMSIDVLWVRPTVWNKYLSLLLISARAILPSLLLNQQRSIYFR